MLKHTLPCLLPLPVASVRGSLGQCGVWLYRQWYGCCVGHKQEEGEMAYTTLLLFFKLDSM